MARALRAAGAAAAAAASRRASRRAGAGAGAPGGAGALFRVAALEAGQERGDLPLWALGPDVAAREAFPLLLGSAATAPEGAAVSRRELAGVAGGFQLLDLLRPRECLELVEVLDGLGFHTDAAVSLPYSFRHMENCNLVVPDEVAEELFQRCSHLLPEVGLCPPLGLNAKFRCYRYGPGDYFRPHTDGAWPGTLARGGKVLMDGYGDRLSQLTFLILLTEGYEGGSTRFFRGPGGEASAAVRTPRGGALCFPHGHHPDSPLHEGERIAEGLKYVIRTEVLYSLEALGRLGHARAQL